MRFKVYDVTLERRRPRGRPRDGVAKVTRKQLRITFDMRIDVVDDARGGHGARAWKSRNETIASEKVVPVPVRDENRGKRPARAGDHIAECSAARLREPRRELRKSAWMSSAKTFDQGRLRLLAQDL